MKASIFCNGEYGNNNLINFENSIVIGVDGGCNYLLNNNIKIDLIVGDLDSIKNKDIIYNTAYIEKTNMDCNDLDIAINYCIENKFSEVYLYGCIGKRTDHFMFNFRLMEKLYKENIEVFMVDEYNIISLFSGEKNFYKENFKFFSIIPVYENTVVSIKGSKYDLNEKKLSLIESLTLSNEWKEDKVTIKSNKIIFICLVY